MGNRGGKLHDPATRTLGTRRWASRRWISCVLAFKARRRDVMGDGYTELFFLDEATALAAGHRPCFECRRQDATRFADAWRTAHALEKAPLADEMDRALHQSRLEGRTQRAHTAAIEALPDGAMIELESRAHLIWGDALFPWTPSGYGRPRKRCAGDARILTPEVIVAVLAAGYAPSIAWRATS